MDLKNLFIKAFEYRSELFENPETNCYRLFNMNADGMEGLTIDIYGEFILVQFFSEHLFEKKMDILKSLLHALQQFFQSIKGVLFKNRCRIKDDVLLQELRKSFLMDGEMPPNDYIVKQNNISAHVDLLHGQNSGIFLDMRNIREKLTKYYDESMKMLNLFCYTGLFSVHALKNGVKKTVNVDISKTVLNRAKKNFELNQIPYDNRDFVNEDTINCLKYYQRKKITFNFVVYDPPTFSRNKKRTYSVKNNFSNNLNIISEISKKGFIFTSTNSTSITKDEYLSYHPPGWELVFFEKESSDFKPGEKSYLKAALWRNK